MTLRTATLIVAASASSSCAMLANFPGAQLASNLTPPTVTFVSATLAQAPSQGQLAAYYCPEVVSVPLGGAAFLCQGFFGPRPNPADMTVGFDLSFRISNPNTVPIPLASVLAAVTVFPATSNQRLGAVCMQLCGEGETGCTGHALPGACQASSRDIRSLDDFRDAAANLLFSTGVSAALGQPPSFVAPRLSASGQIDVAVRFNFGVDQLLDVLRQLASQSVNELRSGHPVTFAIPYRIEGTVFFDAGSLGRIAVGYGPINGTWILPSERLSL